MKLFTKEKKPDDTIEKLFDKGGFLLLQKKCGRLPYGYLRFLTPRSKKIWKHYLAWCWRNSHKKEIKAKNHGWWLHYKAKKPFVCKCKYCGKDFNAPRNWYKICPDCAVKPKKTELMLMAREQRQTTRRHIRAEVQSMYKTGMWRQQDLANMFNVTQKTISNWTRKGRK